MKVDLTTFEPLHHLQNWVLMGVLDDGDDQWQVFWHCHTEQWLVRKIADGQITEVNTLFEDLRDALRGIARRMR